LGLHHLGDLLDQLVRLGASAAMVDQQKCVPSAHGRDVGLRHSCVNASVVDPGRAYGPSVGPAPPPPRYHLRHSDRARLTELT
jgi:hypothetical protein